MYELAVGIPPFSEENPLDIYQNILNSNPRFPSKFSSKAKSLIKHLLSKKVEKRFGNLKRGS